MRDPHTEGVLEGLSDVQRVATGLGRRKLPANLHKIPQVALAFCDFLFQCRGQRLGQSLGQVAQMEVVRRAGLFSSL